MLMHSLHKIACAMAISLLSLKAFPIEDCPKQAGSTNSNCDQLQQNKGNDARQPASAAGPGPVTVNVSTIPDCKSNACDGRKQDVNETNRWATLFSDPTESFTGWIAVVTTVLAWYTFKLWSSGEETTKLHERAYLVGGGLFGVRKTGGARVANDRYDRPRPTANDFTGPWHLMIHNYGRTPGFITKVEWQTCPEAEFPKGASVSKIIDEGHVSGTMNVVNVQEVFAPSGTESVRYRYVECDHRIVGNVFFGRISYADVFGDPHHSTFAIIHKEEHSDSIGKSFSDDWS